MKRALLLSAAVWGCGPAAAAPVPAQAPAVPRIFGEVHTAACSGDPDRLFTFVDGPRLMSNTSLRLLGKPVAAPGSGRTRTDVQAGFSEGGRRWLTAEACAWSFVSAEPVGDEERIAVRTRRGTRAFLYFATEDGSLRLIDEEEPDRPTPVTPPATSAPPSAEQPIGVKECDDYVVRWQECHADPAEREKARPDLDRMAAEWRQLAADPQGRKVLPAGCKMAQDLLASRCGGEHSP